MTLREMMMGNIQGQSATIMQLGAQASRKGTGTGSGTLDFGDILSNRMASAERQAVGKRDLNSVSNMDSKPERDTVSRKETVPAYKTYREAANDAEDSASEPSVNRNEKSTGAADNAKGTENKTKKADENGKDGKAKSEASQDNSPNNMIQAMAQVLGLDMGELQKLLKQAGITSESFNNGKDIAENVSKLSQVLGLTAEQQNTLTKLLELTGQQMNVSENEQKSEEAVLEGKTGEAAGKAQATAAEAGKVVEVIDNRAAGNTEESKSVTPQSEIQAMLAKLDGKIKAKLDEFSGKLKNDQEAVKSELAQMLKPLTEQAAGKTGETAQNPDMDMTVEPGINPETAAAEQNGNASGKDSSGQEESKAESEKEAPQIQITSQAGKETSQAVFTAVQDNRIQNAEPVQKTVSLKTPADAKEIMNQVIEKAKVILTPDKSEMVMDLKPDSLGKISLKVVTENGIVMAKFVAENQQVKQVLESNMQLLKDSLESQGMNVQGFSVSVRQDSNRSAEQWASREENGNRNNGGSSYRMAGIEGSPIPSGNTATKNPYAWGSSTINLTA